MTLSLWAELMADDDVERALPELAQGGLGIGLHLPAERVGDARFAALTRRAADRGVAVRAWPLLSREHGYWIGESNAAEAALLLESIVRWAARPGGPALAGVSLDLEPDFQYAEALRRAGAARVDRLLGLLVAHVDRAHFAAAQATLARAVAAVRRAGLFTHAVTFPLVLDQPEGDTTLEDALDIPVSGIDWDEVSFMVYQTPFAQLTGAWLGPALVHSYACDATARFGARAGIDLGIVGDEGVGVEPGLRYPDPGALVEDRAAALAAGIPDARTRVYGLAGVLASGGTRRWLAGQVVPRAPRPSRAVRGLRAAIAGICTGLRATRP